MAIARDEHIPQTRTRSMSDGISWEQAIMRILSANDMVVRESTKQENIEDHIDIHVHTMVMTIDVKSYKRWEFSRAKPNEIYLEVLNVVGRPGWIFGKASHVVFVNGRTAIMIPRKVLQDIVRDKCGSMKDVSSWSSKPDLYKYYNRDGRKDAVTKVTEDDLLSYGGILIRMPGV